MFISCTLHDKPFVKKLIIQSRWVDTAKININIQCAQPDILNKLKLCVCSTYMFVRVWEFNSCIYHYHC